MTGIASLAALLSLALSGAQFAQAQQWIDHQPSGTGYRAEFPAKPVENNHDLGTPAGPAKIRTSAVDIGGKIFMTIDAAYPMNVDGGDAQANLDSARDGGVRNVNGMLRQEERLPVGSAPDGDRHAANQPGRRRPADSRRSPPLPGGLHRTARDERKRPTSGAFSRSFALMR